MITPETIARHELVGLPVRVVDDTDDRAGIDGTVVDETTSTLVIGADDGDTKTVPKAEATFAFELGSETVVVDGDRLVARPARRTETGEDTWHSA